MANVQRGPLTYIDTTGILTEDAALVSRVLLSATSANAVLVLGDSAGTTVLKLQAATSGTTTHFDFAYAPLAFPAGIKVVTLTNGVATLVTTSGKGRGGN
jgi:hypothetical protein